MRHIFVFKTSNNQNNGLNNYETELVKELEKIVVISKLNYAININSMLCVLAKVLRMDLAGILNNYPLSLILPKKSIIHFTSQQQTICLNYLRRRAIVTVHDIIPLATNKFNSFAAKLLYLLAMRGLKRAKFIIADSEHTKKDIIKFLNYSEHKIKVIPLGVDHNYFKPSKIKRDKFTILYVGSEMPRKNVLTLLKAFKLVKQKIPQAKLIKVGLPQWPGARNKLIKFVKENNLQNAVIFKDYVENLAQEYQKASIFVFPSKYEGFGLPPLEAMACGCPVICSNATSLPEVVGDSAILFNPNNVLELAEKMLTLLNAQNLQKKYSAKGIKRSKEFSWEKCAKETLNIYKKLC